MGLKRVRISARLLEGYVVEAIARNHRIVMDLPEKVGGKDAGPTPVEYLLASLAGCIGMAARRHEQRFGLKIDSMDITVEGEYDPRGFEGEDVKPGIQRIKVVVKVSTDADEARLREFIKFVEDHCPIEDTLKSIVGIEVEVQKA